MTRFLAPLCALFATCVLAQTPYLVKDIKTAGVDAVYSSSAQSFVADGNAVYFFAQTEAAGRELWRYANGSATLVKDIAPPTSAIWPRALQLIGSGVLLFGADDGVHGPELWRSDGTEAGTVLVREINPTGDSAMISKGVFGGLAYFSANDGVHGAEMWASDGTEAGTRLVKDFNGTSASSWFAIAGYLGDRLLVASATSLWLTDGTEAGTTLVKANIYPGPPVVVGTKAYFSAYDADAGYELWSTDGTTDGTQRVIDIVPGTGSSIANSTVPFTVLGTDVLFFVNPAVPNAWDLWRTDGTAAGTHFVARTGIAVQCTSGCPRDTPAPVAASGIAYFHDWDAALWRTDGTAEGTFRLETSGLTSPPFRAFGGAIYYAKNSVLRTTDGTPTGTTTALTLTDATTPVYFSFTGGRLYFSANGSHGFEPWVSEDGTAASTYRIADLNADAAPSSNPAKLVASGDKVFFFAYDDSGADGVWSSDGTSGGTRKIEAAPNGRDSIHYDFFMRGLGGALYYRKASDELWRSDGTVEGTVLVKEFPAAIQSLTASSTLLYATTDGQNNLWRSDGTTVGTYDLQPTPAGPYQMGNAVGELAGAQYFAEGSYSELWKTEGFPGTTRIVGAKVSYLGATAALGAFFYSYSDYEHGAELWRTDGSPEGTKLLKDLWPGTSSSSPTLFTAAGAYLYFVAWTAGNEPQLFRTDGTEVGTIVLKSFWPGSAPTSSEAFSAVGDFLYFVATDLAHGTELWRSDGTPEGTVLVKDIAPGSAGSTPSSLIAVDGELWFAADNGGNGRELWRSDGSEGGTVLAADIAPGPGSSSPNKMTVAGRRMYFSANDGVVGFELWAMDLDGSAFSIADVRTAEGNAGTKTLRFTVVRAGDTTSAASVAYATEDVTATNSSDYTTAAGSLTFLSGETSKTLDITINGDAINEEEESFFVVLSSPVGAALARNRATGIIQNDDQSVDLVVEIAITGSETERNFNVTNNGGSTATGVQVRVTESPAIVPFRTIAVPAIAPGETKAVSYSRPSSFGHPNPALILDYDRRPGYTVTATVTSSESELTPADNTQSRMMNESCSLLLPPFVAVSASAPGKVLVASAVSFTTDSLLTITPSTIPAASQSYHAPITVQGGATPGRSALTASIAYSVSTLTYPVVAVGQTAKLDTALSVITETGTYGQPLQFQAFIRGARPDGALPTGTVTFKDNGGGTIAQAVLDANASVMFTRSGLSAGTWPHWIEYSGDGSFNPMHGRFYLSFAQATTTTTGVLTRTSCYVAEGRITVKAASGTVAPEGKITVMMGGNTLASLTLAPTGQPGEASAMVRIQLPGKNNALEFWYSPSMNSNYTFSSTTQTIAFPDCGGMGTALYTMTPCRILDTRNSTGPFGGPALGIGVERTVQIAGRCGVSATAKAVTVNVTVVNPTTTAYLRLLPSGILPRPVTTTVSYRIGKTRAMNTIINLNSDGAIDVYNAGSAAVHFIIDAYGYFQ